MHITPFTEEELENPMQGQFGAGTYLFRIENFMEKLSQSGLPGVEFSLRLIKDKNESSFYVKTRLYFSDKARWKIAEFFKCIGKKELLKAEEIDFRQLVGLYGKAEFLEEVSSVNGKKYLKADSFLPYQHHQPNEKRVSPQAPEFVDDDIPF